MPNLAASFLIRKQASDEPALLISALKICLWYAIEGSPNQKATLSGQVRTIVISKWRACWVCGYWVVCRRLLCLSILSGVNTQRSAAVTFCPTLRCYGKAEFGLDQIGLLNTKCGRLEGRLLLCNVLSFVLL